MIPKKFGEGGGERRVIGRVPPCRARIDNPPCRRRPSLRPGIEACPRCHSLLLHNSAVLLAIPNEYSIISLNILYTVHQWIVLFGAAASVKVFPHASRALRKSTTSSPRSPLARTGRLGIVIVCSKCHLEQASPGLIRSSALFSSRCVIR